MPLVVREMKVDEVDLVIDYFHRSTPGHLQMLGVDPSLLGSECVRATADLYFKVLGLERLFCQPNALNVAPNRTLQRAGFRYVKTYETVPGALNHYQAVTLWVLDSPRVTAGSSDR